MPEIGWGSTGKIDTNISLITLIIHGRTNRTKFGLDFSTQFALITRSVLFKRSNISEIRNMHLGEDVDPYLVHVW